MRYKVSELLLAAGLLVALTSPVLSLTALPGSDPIAQMQGDIRTTVVHRHYQHYRSGVRPYYVPYSGRDPYTYTSPFAPSRQHQDYLRSYGFGQGLGIGQGRSYWSFDW